MAIVRGWCSETHSAGELSAEEIQSGSQTVVAESGGLELLFPELGDAYTHEGPITFVVSATTSAPEPALAWRTAGPVERAPFPHRVAGCDFLLEIDEDGEIIIFHPTCSLVGMGNTIVEAELALIQRARMSADLFLMVAPSEQTVETLEVAEFVRRVA